MALKGTEADKSQQLSLEWQNLTYTITAAKAKEGQEAVRTILGDVSGRALPGTLTAIMGPSGSGKTSLLNALAGRVPISTGGALQGSVLLNGAPASNDTLAAHSAYVEQDDALFALSTVSETLLFAAQLRLPSSMPLAEKKQRVEGVITELGLADARDTLIGNSQTRGISGGERKRVNLGTSMLAGDTNAAEGGQPRARS